MTCREFKHIAASFSLKEWVERQDAEMTDHVSSCPACGAWMEKQRSLNASLHTLRVRTSGLEAGSDVEGALLRVFRQGTPVVDVSTATAQLAVVGGRAAAGVKEPKSQAAPFSTPLALRLSRFFEVGAYAAVAAALVIAFLLGLLLVRQGHKAAPIRGQSVPASAAPVVAASSKTPNTAPVAIARPALKARPSHRLSASQTVAPQQPSPVADYASQADADDGYTALMLCDPLSCASGTQVVRMELPESTGAQPQVADVVVGYDGVVRAVRFVN